MTQQQFSRKVQELIDEGISWKSAIEWVAAEQAYDELGR